MSEESVAAATVRHARRIAVAVVGGTVLLVGLALLVLPGPAFLVIPAGLGILAAEFAWARHWLRIVKERAQQAVDAAGSWSGGTRPGEPAIRAIDASGAAEPDGSAREPEDGSRRGGGAPPPAV